MSKTERLYRIEALIKARGTVSFQDLLDELEVSRATLKRDLEYLRDRLGAPIEYDRFANGYRFAPGARGARHELPGLWFDERELYSLLMAHQLLSELDGDGVLGRHLQPLLERIHEMLGTTEAEAKAIVKRVKIVGTARRPVPTRAFERVVDALVRRRQMHLRYLTREVTERDVSPQRMVHHRNTWYLDAWCHRSDGLRRFALDAIQDATVLDDKAREVPLRQVQQEMDGGYGIYAGSRPAWVTLRFAPQVAQWVSREEWHPKQETRWADHGAYELKLPYTNPTELAMDILRHSGDVEIVEDSGVVGQLVSDRLARAVARQPHQVASKPERDRGDRADAD